MEQQKTLTLAALALATAAAAAAQDTRRPNVVLILADDLGYGDVSAYGQTSIQTPNIDRLAHGGVCFTDGHATSATSTPSRYGLFTGMYPWKNANAHILPGDAPLIVATDQYTLPRMFQHAGYATAAVGKWHLGMGRGKINWNDVIRPGAREIGFDYSCIIAATVDRVPTVYVENGRVVGLDPADPIEVNYEHNFPGEPTLRDNPELVRMPSSHGHDNTVVHGIGRIGFMRGGHAARWQDDRMAQYFLDRCSAFIDANKHQPFFLYYGLHQPHVPRVADPRFAGRTQLGPRGDVIVEADWCVGQLIDKLEREGLLDNTIIIFSSDNGPVLDDGYDDGARASAPLHDPMGGLRGGKYSLFDAGTRVPFFVYWRGHIRPLVSDALVSQQDLLASLAAMLRQPVPAGLDSENLLSTFLGKSRRARREMIVEAAGRLAYRCGHYALIPPYRGAQRNATGNELGVVSDYTLYDLQADPSQHLDITATHPRLLRKFRRRFLQLVGEHYQENRQQEALK